MIKFPCTEVTDIPHRSMWMARHRWNSTVGPVFEGFVLAKATGDVYYLTTQNVAFIDNLEYMTTVDQKPL